MLYLRPDSKSQVTIEYDAQNRPVRIDTIVLSTQHDEGVSSELIKQDVINILLPRVAKRDSRYGHLLHDFLEDKNAKLLVNPTGNFVIGGPHGDTGLTGRKIIVDTYGGRGAHGGGAFSGKDPTKVDRSAAYAARYVAKNIVAAGIAKKCEVQVAYAIGVEEPVSVFVETFSTGIIPDSEISKIVAKVFDLRPASIIETLGLRKPIYRKLAALGHIGRTDVDVAWEKTDKVDEIRKAANL